MEMPYGVEAMNEDRIIILTNPKKHITYRVEVPEDRQAYFESTMRGNGFRFTEIGQSKQAVIAIDIEMEIRRGK